MQIALGFLLFTTMITAWGPTRPGALVKRVGDLLIVNQSVRILLHLDNVTYIADSLGHIKEGLKVVQDRLSEANITNPRLTSKIGEIQHKVLDLEAHFVHTRRSKRAVAVAAAIGGLAGLGLANTAWNAHLQYKVNSLELSVARVEDLHLTVQDMQDTIDTVADNVEFDHDVTNLVRESLDIFMLLDQLYIKLLEVDAGIKQLIQDLVLANSGSVTSTLLPISNLINITERARTEWSFRPFFGKDSIALYYPLLNSYVNGTSVVIDIPFSSELKFHIYKLIPFPFRLNHTVLEVDPVVVEPQNYVLSLDSFKESQIRNDDLWTCKRTNLDLYLCPSTYFTLNQALSDSCAASLVKNVSISQNCHFHAVAPTPRHETVQNSHFMFFPNITTVSVSCPGFSPKIASVTGLYQVPDQCSLHSSVLITIPNRLKNVDIKKDAILVQVVTQLPAHMPKLKIKRTVKRLTTVMSPNGSVSLVLLSLMAAFLLICVIIVILLVVKLKKTPRVVRHVHTAA